MSNGSWPATAAYLFMAMLVVSRVLLPSVPGGPKVSGVFGRVSFVVAGLLLVAGATLWEFPMTAIDHEIQLAALIGFFLHVTGVNVLHLVERRPAKSLKP